MSPNYIDDARLHEKRILKRTITELGNNEWKNMNLSIMGGYNWNRSIEDEVMIQLFNSLSVNRYVRYLTLKNITMGRQSQVALNDCLSINKLIETIVIVNVKGEDNDHNTQRLIVSKSILGSLRCSSVLQTLTLEYCTFNPQFCRAMNTFLKNEDHCTLEYIRLDQIYFSRSSDEDTSGIDLFSHGIAQSKSLKSLTLENLMNLSTRGVNNLLTAIGKCSSLRTLNLKRMNLDYIHSDALASILSSPETNIQSISLQLNNLDARSIATVMNTGLVNNKVLKRLDLSDNPMGNDGTPSIVSCLQRNSCLESLLIMNCEIWHDGCTQIARGIASFQGLKCLYMNQNSIDLCGHDFLRSIQINTTIHSIITPELMEHMMIDASRNYGEIPESSVTNTWKKIQFYLKLNMANRSFIQQLNKDQTIPVGCLAHFFSRPIVQRNVDVLFHFLQEIRVEQIVEWDLEKRNNESSCVIDTS